MRPHQQLATGGRSVLVALPVIGAMYVNPDGMTTLEMIRELNLVSLEFA
jgi:hypothetical protein